MPFLCTRTFRTGDIFKACVYTRVNAKTVTVLVVYTEKLFVTWHYACGEKISWRIENARTHTHNVLPLHRVTMSGRNELLKLIAV